MFFVHTPFLAQFLLYASRSVKLEALADLRICPKSNVYERVFYTRSVAERKRFVKCQRRYYQSLPGNCLREALSSRAFSRFYRFGFPWASSDLRVLNTISEPIVSGRNASKPASARYRSSSGISKMWAP
mgnify:CR=1 FL=1